MQGTSAVNPQEWARLRYADVQRREHGNSLSVSEEKPLGGVVVPWFSPVRFKASFIAIGRGPEVAVLTAPIDAMGSRSYAIYAYHRAGLQRVLREHADVLRAAGWPTAPSAFIEASRRKHAAVQTRLYDCIADAYGDKLNPGRTDVLPWIERRTLLAAYLDFAGHNDGSMVFFPTGVVPRPYLQPNGRYGSRDHGLDADSLARHHGT